LGICTSGTKSETSDLVSEMNLTFTMAHDFDDVYSTKFGADSEPILVLLDQNLKIVDIYNDIYPSELKKALKEIGVLD